MSQVKTWLGALALVTSANAYATILPPNNLHLQDHPAFTSNITEQEFNDIINKIVEIYKPVVASHGANLVSKNLWTNGTVNASAQQIGKDWIINMYGGLARRQETTKEGFALVVCHELGHHLGGFPLYSSFSGWAATEGQSDYFATQACARKIWASDLEENAKAVELVNPVAKDACDVSWTSQEDKNLCYRTSLGSQSLANLLAALNQDKAPQFDTPDLKEVGSTYEAHPAAQCRLDTYFNGSLCSVPFDANLIPGKNHPAGQGSIAAEEVAAKYSCNFFANQAKSARPHCWFKPRLEFMGLRSGGFEFQELTGNGNGIIEPGESASVLLTLANRNTETTSQVKAQMVVGKGATVALGESTYGDIEPGAEQKNEMPLVLNIANDAACGSTIDVNVKASSLTGLSSMKSSFMLGKLVETLVGENSTATSIPDNSSWGVTSRVKNSNAASSQFVSVKLNITHPNVADLRAQLVSPRSTYKTLFNRGERKGENLSETFLVDMKVSNAIGDWQLRIYDGASGNVGQLDSWSLAFGVPHCE